MPQSQPRLPGLEPPCSMGSGARSPKALPSTRPPNRGFAQSSDPARLRRWKYLSYTEPRAGLAVD
jgi:hypothetical protein